LSENHISYYTTVRGLDILGNVTVLGYVIFYQVNKFFVNVLFLHCKQNVFAGQIWPTAVVWRCFFCHRLLDGQDRYLLSGVNCARAQQNLQKARTFGKQLLCIEVKASRKQYTGDNQN